MEWKARLIIYQSMDLWLNQIHYRRTLSADEINLIRQSFQEFTSLVGQLTSNQITMICDPVQDVVVAPELKSISYWPDDDDVYPDPRCDGKDELRQYQWGEYDSVFVVYPQGKNTCHANFNWHAASGASYSAFAAYRLDLKQTPPKSFWAGLDHCQGEGFLHGWLHGVCFWFSELGWQMPVKDVDGQSENGYASAADGCWRSYYADLMNARVQGNLGIPSDAWSAGSVRSYRKFIGFRAYDRNPYINLHSAFMPMAIPKNAVHKWRDGELQDFYHPAGECAILQGYNRGHFLVPPEFWSAYLEHGGFDLGYPVSEVHAWGDGLIQDFETADNTWHTGIMKNAAGGICAVKGLVWKHYLRAPGCGANSYLGYPISNEEIMSGGDDHEAFWVQKFQGGYIYVKQNAPDFAGDVPWSQVAGTRLGNAANHPIPDIQP